VHDEVGWQCSYLFDRAIYCHVERGAATGLGSEGSRSLAAKGVIEN
jgi:hypothetical protein